MNAVQEALKQLVIELIKLIVSGIIGGLFVHYMSIRQFKTQKKIDAQREFQSKRLDALRDLRLALHWLRRDIFYNWEKPIKEGQTPDEYMVDVMNRVNYWETLFLNDENMSSTLWKYRSLVGASHDSIYKYGEKPLGEIITEIQSTIDNKIIQIEKLITT